MKRIILTIIVALLVSIVASSQERKIIGRIFDAQTQKPISDTHVIIQGTTIGTFSNQLGFFELVVDSSIHKTIIASNIGFKTSEVRIPAANKFKFQLEKEYTVLQKVNLNSYPQDIVNKQLIEDEVASDKSIVVESNAEFSGGVTGISGFVGNSLVKENLVIPDTGIEIKFTITEKGSVSNILVSDTSTSVIRAVNKMFQQMPLWTPASQRQKNVEQHFSLPVVRINPIDPSKVDLSDFYSYVSKNVTYPFQARRMNLEGPVIVEFQADLSGNILVLKIVQDIKGDCGAEVSRVIFNTPTEILKSLTSKTNSTYFTLPVLFGLDGPFKGKKLTPNPKTVLLNEVNITVYAVRREVKVNSPSYLPNGRIMMAPNSNRIYTNLNEALKQPKSVIRLSLIRNGLSSFPPKILKLSNLESLDLETNHLQSLPTEVTSLIKLEQLYLVENKLEALPANFGDLKKLKVLGLADNQFKSFPLEILSLENLETLDLGDNQLSSIPSGINSLKNLKILVLQNNSISKIPPEFAELKNLKELYLQGNPIDPKEIEQLKVLLKNTEIQF